MKIKLKYKVVQREDGLFYVFKRKGIYWTQSYPTEIEAIKASIHREGIEISDRLDDVQKRMESIPGYIDSTDPYGWRS